MPGNAGGAKGPDFWCAFEDGEVVVIGDEPENTIKDRGRPRLLCRGVKVRLSRDMRSPGWSNVRARGLNPGPYPNRERGNALEGPGYPTTIRRPNGFSAWA